MKVRLEASRLLTYQAAWRLEQTRAAAMDASIAKLHVSDSLVASAHDPVQIMGGYGFLVEQGVERTLRDAVGEHDLFGHERDAEVDHRPLARSLSRCTEPFFSEHGAALHFSRTARLIP